LIVKGFQSKKQEAGPGLVFCWSGTFGARWCDAWLE
jgi:hypothetical protein